MIFRRYQCKNVKCKRPGPKTITGPMPYAPECGYCKQRMTESEDY